MRRRSVGASERPLTLVDRDASNGFVLMGHGTTVDFASPSAQRLLREYFGAETVRLPG